MKKVTCFILLLAMFISCIPLALGVSASGDDVTFVFDTPESIAALTGAQGVDLSFDSAEKAAKLLVNADGAGHYAFLNLDGLGVDASEYTAFMCVFKVPRTVSSTAKQCEVFFQNGDVTVPTAGMSKTISIGATSKGKWVAKTIQLSTLDFWSGVCHSIRFDCFSNAKSGDVMYLDSITFTKNARAQEEVKKTRLLNKAMDADISGEYYAFSYDVTKYVAPYWKGNIVYNEAVYPIKDENGNPTFTLMYTPDTVIAVTDALFDHLYVEGVDYTVEGNVLTIPEDSSIYVRDYSSLHYEGANPGSSYYPGLAAGGNKYELISTNVARDYLNITYTHSDTWQGPVPANHSDALPLTAAAIANQGTLNIVYYGDSICGGARCSGSEGIYPYAQRWNEMISASLEKDYGVTVNTTISAVGGSDAVTMSSSDKVQSFVKDNNPDLVVIEFGTNDAQNYSVDDNATAAQLKTAYKNGVVSIINQVRDGNSDCEFLLVAPFYSNLIDFKKSYFEVCRDALNEIAAEKTGVAVADVTTVHDYLLGFKNYADFSGDNLCHPNDFMSRIYSQVCLEAMVPQGAEPLNVAPVTECQLYGHDFVDGVCTRCHVNESGFVPGDADGDGLVTSADVTFMRSAFAGHISRDLLTSAVDLNDDGVVNAKDLLLLRKMLAN